MDLPTRVDYPVIAIGDVHGQIGFLDRLLERLRRLDVWPVSRVVFLGDLVDRGPDVRGTIDRVLEVFDERPGSTAIMGNHDLGLVRAAQLDDGPESADWVPRYAYNYDHIPTFLSYLNREPCHDTQAVWRVDLQALREAIPERHRRFLAGLPWVVEAARHVFVHNGLSHELEATAEEQLAALRRRHWDRDLRPRPGSRTDEMWNPEYPVWLGADKAISARPKPLFGRTLVVGHVWVDRPDVTPVRIRMDTSGGYREPLTACVLRSPEASPEFITSNG